MYVYTYIYTYVYTILYAHTISSYTVQIHSNICPDIAVGHSPGTLTLVINKGLAANAQISQTPTNHG